MNKKRASLHSGKKSQKTGKIIKPPHNDESREKNENVKAELVGGNYYWNWVDGEYTSASQEDKLTFQDAELKYYTEHYQTALDSQNERHIKARQKKRIKSMDNWLDSQRYAPTETILRVGNVDVGFADSLSLKEMTEEYIEKLNEWSADHNDCLHILDYALHADEYYVDEETGEEKPSSTHVHLRYVWDYVDERGNRTVGCEKALENAGYERPYPDMKESRKNNRLKTFTAEFREKWQEIILNHGYDIETTPLPTKRKAKDKSTYVAEKRAYIAEQKAVEKERQAFAREQQAAEEIAKVQALQAEYEKKLAELSAKETHLYYKELTLSNEEETLGIIFNKNKEKLDAEAEKNRIDAQNNEKWAQSLYKREMSVANQERNLQERINRTKERERININNANLLIEKKNNLIIISNTIKNVKDKEKLQTAITDTLPNDFDPLQMQTSDDDDDTDFGKK